jgi:cob(I)alamin adenosyltransferase
VKIYTRKGDKGETSLLGKGRVSKSSIRVEAYGTVDELGAVLGTAASTARHAPIRELIYGLQKDLHTLAADLARPEPAKGEARITAAHVDALEKHCDTVDSELPPLERFILAGGTPGAAQLHVARTVARRAERRVVNLSESEPVNPEVLRYLNRLADLLFLLARLENVTAGEPERHPYDD